MFRNFLSMKSSILLPCIYLVIGSALGYSLRLMQTKTGEAANVVSSAAVKKTGTEGVGKVQTTSGKGAGQVMRQQSSMVDELKELLADYDTRSVKKALSGLSLQEIKQAFTHLNEMPKTQEREALRAQLYAAWAELDFDAAWRAVQADPLDQKSRGALSGAVVAVKARTDPMAALELAMSLGMGTKRTTVISSIFTEWSKKDVAAALNYSLTHPEIPLESFMFISSLKKMAETDAHQAAGLVMNINDSMRRNSLLTSIVESWVERDPNAALRWAQSLTNPKQREDATASVVGAWAKSDPVGAMAYVQSISDTATRQNAFKNAWRDWFKDSPVSAVDFLMSLQDDGMREAVRFEFSYYSENLTPRERASLLGKLPDGNFKDEIMRTMTDNQIRKGQFNEALEMLNAMPDSRNRDRSVVKLGQEWARADLKAAEKWLNMQPDSTDRDLATAGYAAELARRNPQQAVRLAEGIPDSKVREGALVAVATAWLRADAVSARNWMATQPYFTENRIKSMEQMSKLNLDYVTPTISVGNRR